MRGAQERKGRTCPNKRRSRKSRYSTRSSRSKTWTPPQAVLRLPAAMRRICLAALWRIEQAVLMRIDAPYTAPMATSSPSAPPRWRKTACVGATTAASTPRSSTKACVLAAGLTANGPAAVRQDHGGGHAVRLLRRGARARANTPLGAPAYGAAIRYRVSSSRDLSPLCRLYRASCQTPHSGRRSIRSPG